MIGIREFLRDRRKAELQAMARFWLPGATHPALKPELEEVLLGAMTESGGLEERVQRLTANEKVLVECVLSSNSRSATVQDVQQALTAVGATSSEVDATTRTIVQRGFCLRSTEGGAVTYTLPNELAEGLRREVPEFAHRDRGTQLMQRRLELGETMPDSMERALEGVVHPALRQLVDMALERGGMLPLDDDNVSAELREAIDVRAARIALEADGIGTVGGVSLKDYGVTIDEPSVVLFQDLVRSHFEANLEADAEPDQIVEAGVDLYADLDLLARRLEADPLPLTREGRVPKRWQDRLRETLALSRLEPHLDGDYAGWIFDLALRLGIVETHGKTIRVESDRLRSWRKLDVSRQLEAVLARTISDKRGSRWTFHQGFLRRIFLEVLANGPKDSWTSIDALVHVTVSTYLLELEERGVREALQERRQEDFARERLTSPFHRLGTDLRFWVVHRLVPLGLCEIGLVDRRFQALRPSALGRRHFGDPLEDRQSRLLVNPDFEVMLFCEDLHGLRLELALTRFADRQSAERVRRYRVTPASIREGVRSGLSTTDIRDILESGSDHPLPETVLVTLADVGRDLDWLELRRSIVVHGLCPRSEDELRLATDDLGLHCEVLPGDRLLVELGPDIEIRDLVDALRGKGLLVRDPHVPNRSNQQTPKRA